ncbi:hypothetical protein WR25_00126 [Diploscapter pachys]|uniref:Ribosomal protein L46 N-terminal domain-containing protein n=1 Tax=Diploscapter pachys TaxID=2018661 RepID=A0A2A2KSW4_9BILA|nr:hypothetical protein WR25_00126 [Diploscapter pachys]
MRLTGLIRYAESALQQEFEGSLTNNFELKTKKDEELLKKRDELERQGKELSELDGQLGITNSMKLDDWVKNADELTKKFKFDNSKAFEADDVRSLSRALDRKLVLLVKQRFGDKKYESPWILPQLKYNNEASLRETAERCIGEITSGNVEVALHGNAPVAVHTHKYQKPIKSKTGTGADGAKIFFYTASLAKKAKFTTNQDEVVDFQWATSEEFENLVINRKYRNRVKHVFYE